MSAFASMSMLPRGEAFFCWSVAENIFHYFRSIAYFHFSQFFLKICFVLDAIQQHTVNGVYIFYMSFQLFFRVAADTLYVFAVSFMNNWCM